MPVSLSRLAFILTLSLALFRNPAAAQSAPEVSLLVPTEVTGSQTTAAALGATIELVAGHRGTGPFSVRWLRDGAVVAESANITSFTSVLTLAPLRATDAGIYWFEASNAAGTTQSRWAFVAVLPSSGPSPTTRVDLVPVTSTTRNEGQALGLFAYFRRAFSPGGPINPSGIDDSNRYQWLRDGTPIPGATAPQYFIPRVAGADAGNYSVAVTYDVGTVRSEAVAVSVAPGSAPPTKPFIYAYAVPSTPPSAPNTGTPVSFSVEVISASPVSYEWYRDGVLLSQFTGPQLYLPSPRIADSGRYTLVVRNDQSSVQAFTSTFLVTTGRRPPVVLEEPPAKVELTPGQFITVRFITDSDSDSTVQWTKDGQPLTPFVDDRETLTIGIGRYSPGTYAASATNAYGVTRSRPMVITLAPPDPGGTYAGTNSELFGDRLRIYTAASGIVAYVRPDRSATVISIAQPNSSSSPFVIERTTPDADGGLSLPPLTPNSPTLTFTSTSLNFLSTRAPALNTVANRTVGGPLLESSGYFRGRSEGTDGGEAHAIVGADGLAGVLVNAAGQTHSCFVKFRFGESLTFSLTSATQGTLAASFDPAVPQITGTIRTPDGRVRSFTLARAEGPLRGRLANLASRGFVGPDAQAMIAGFTLAGTGQSRVLIRGIGPTLGVFGVASALTATAVRLYRGTTLIAQNDDWSTAPDAAGLATTALTVGAFALPAGSRDAAVLPLLSPASYTAQVLDTANRTGVALAEVYNAAPNTPGNAQLSNLSLRGYVGFGENALIAGLVVDGVAPQRLLIRAIGPGLDGFGVSGALRDPRLRVYREDRLAAEQDNWGDSVTVANTATSVGAFPLPVFSKDAALIVTLPPGTYTAQVTGSDGGVGVALVEAYLLP